MDEPERLRTVPEVARELRVDRETVYRAIRRGELEVVRFGGVIRVPSKTLDRLLLRRPSREDRPRWWSTSEPATAADISKAAVVSFLGSVGADYVERTKLELDRAMAASRIVELRTSPQFREYKLDELTNGPFGSLVDAEGNRFRVTQGECFHRGRLLDQLSPELCAFVVRGDVDPAAILVLERVRV
jgi:excisionase family DNA binding protein